MIDWKERISVDNFGTEYIDMQGLPYYNLEYDDKCSWEIMYDVKVKLPKEPEDHLCVNYGLSEYDQIFRKTFIPKQVRNPNIDYGRENWTEKQLRAFIDSEYNKRKNGLWMFIKGKKYYIPGQLWFKLNHWTPSTDEVLEYRDNERTFFTLALQIQRDPMDLGIVDFKCRQLGDTESSLVIMYERGSRIRGGLTTMQSFVGEEHIKETYGRLVHGHNNMIYYFKPMSDGTEKAAAGLRFKYPSKQITHAEVKRQQQNKGLINSSSIEEYQFPPLNSRFRYGTSKAIKFDGATGILTSYGDEFGKASDTDPNEWLRTMVEAVYSNLRGKKRGFVIMTSTAEEITSETLEYARTLYKESDPSKRLKTGSTLNRVIRIFRGVGCRGFENIIADRWGFIDEEAVIAAVTEKFNAMVEAGNTKGAYSFIRKNPRDIEDVFKSANNQTQFDVEKLTNRETSLELERPRPWVRGNLKWLNNEQDTTVIWEPNPNGRWIISKHPKDFGLESNKKGLWGNNIPGNKNFFCMGIDPIDQAKTLESNPSRMGMTVMRRFDPMVDSSEGLYHKMDDEVKGIRKGDPVDLGGMHITNKPVCTYLHRDGNILNNFEDAILTMVYYGTDFLIEKQRAGALQTYLATRKYKSYSTEHATMVKNVKGQTELDGVHATEKSWQDVFSYLESYIAKWANAIDHPDLLIQLSSMNMKNRGERDLGVSFGWCLYHSYQKPYKRTDQEENQTEEQRNYWEQEEYNEV